MGQFLLSFQLHGRSCRESTTVLPLGMLAEVTLFEQRMRLKYSVSMNSNTVGTLLDYSNVSNYPNVRVETYFVKIDIQKDIVRLYGLIYVIVRIILIFVVIVFFFSFSFFIFSLFNISVYWEIHLQSLDLLSILLF